MARVAVVGVPDARWGQAVHAFVVPRAGTSAQASEDTLRAWCREQLAGYKCSRDYSFVAELPLSAADKVLKHRLREQVMT